MADGGFPMVTLAALKDVRRWVAWKTEQRNGKDTKVPYAPTGGKAKANDPRTWGARAAAETEAARLTVPGNIGIQLGDHFGLALGGIDLDSCRSADGVIATWAADVMERFASYAEVSPSGTGVKIFFAMLPDAFQAALAALGNNTQGEQRHGCKFAQASAGDHPPAIEVYVSHRYFTVTGQQCPMAPSELRFIDAETLLWLLREAGPALVGEPPRAADTSPAGLFHAAKAQLQTSGRDKSRSAVAFGIACQVKRDDGSYADMLAALAADARTTEWLAEKGKANGQRELKRMWEKAKAVAPAAWLAKCQYGNDGPRGNLHNVMLALREDDRIRGAFRWDAMLRAVVRPDGGECRPVTDEDVSALQEWLQKEGLETISRDTTHQAVRAIAMEHSFHPVQDYLIGLVWDGKPRVATWLHSYVGAENTDYTKGIGRMFLIAMVARAMEPGCKADYILAFEGPQGAGKSTACRVLGGPWFSDSLPDIGRDDVRVSQHLRGKWLIEIAELSAMGKAENAALKAFITRSEEIFIEKYGRLERHEPRQCLFAGTTNNSAYLRDETGARRFWPVKVGTIDADALARDRDQLFAEAMQLYRQGEGWWPDAAFEAEHIKPEQEKRYEADAWEQAIGEWLDERMKQEAAGDRDLPPLTVLSVAKGALHMETPKIGTQDQRRITAAMGRLGWERGERTMHGRPWVRRTDA